MRVFYTEIRLMKNDSLNSSLSKKELAQKQRDIAEKAKIINEFISFSNKYYQKFFKK